MSRLTIFCLSFSLFACYGGATPDTGETAGTFDSATPGTTTTPDSDTTDSATTDSTTTDSATTDSNPVDTAPTEPPVHFWELANPCPGATYALSFDTTDGWVGCGDGGGLWHTDDAGESFTEGHPNTWTQELYVTDLATDPLGGLLVCGHDYGTGTLLYRYRDGEWSELLRYGNNTTDATAVQMSNCGVVAAAGDGTMMVASLTVGDLSFSSDDGQSWSKEGRYWEDANLDAGGYAYYYMLNLVATGGQYFGAGSDISSPPVFFGPSQHAEGTWQNFHATALDTETQGELWALATPDGGLTWIAGGRDQRYSSVASGFLFRSTDGGLTWTKTRLGGDFDVVHDVVFAEDGLHGVAVGHRYPVSHGGFMLTTEDGGFSWTEREESVPPLYVAAIVGTDFWVAGDAFLGRGEI